METRGFVSAIQTGSQKKLPVGKMALVIFDLAILIFAWPYIFAPKPATIQFTSHTASASSPSMHLQITSTPTGYLNVRDAPALTGAVITKVTPGSDFVYSKIQDGWYFITVNQTTAGWVAAQYIHVQ